MSCDDSICCCLGIAAVACCLLGSTKQSEGDVEIYDDKDGYFHRKIGSVDTKTGAVYNNENNPRNLGSVDIRTGAVYEGTFLGDMVGTIDSAGCVYDSSDIFSSPRKIGRMEITDEDSKANRGMLVAGARFLLMRERAAQASQT